ncbi:oligoribonuclease, mitochondrial [Melitaea cinxia]|uniref:oligoribonuclease, mitochondrial n=1 Tax=Melitaea cinxia TaxID=113334 RepID=UPI0004EA9429|nr:oligoribonuclease, mitochondrial [Melitaea cinxia]
MNFLQQSLTSRTRYFLNILLKPNICLQTKMSFNSSELKCGAKRIVWVDLEMTGLDINKDHILEIACLVTDGNLNVIAEGPNIIIHQPNEILSGMNEWCITQHGESGLTEASRKSNISVADAEKQILNFVKSHVPEKKCPLGGNSVYMDRLFLRKYMPKFNDYLHYRIIDVSTIKELAKRWYQREYSRLPPKTFQHRCLNDIKESIEEIKYYKENIFK